jgi:hypothetical protein
MMRRPSRTRNRKLLFGTLVVMLIATLLPLAPAAAQAGVTMSIRPGFDGYCKPASWIPVVVAVENQGPDLEAQIEITFPAPSNPSVYAYPISLPTVSRKEVPVYIYHSGFLSSVTVRLMANGRQVATARSNISCLSEADALYGILSDNSGALAVLSNLHPPAGRAVTARLGLDTLPDRGAVLKSLDMIVFSDIDTSRMSADQRTALENWVSGGGRLVIVGGPNWQKTAAGLGNLLPFRASGTQTLADLRAVSSYLPDADPLSGQAVITVGDLEPGAQAVISQDDVPLVVVRTLGYGQVFYLTFDPSLAPIQRWNSLEQFFSTLFASRTSRPGWTYGVRNWSYASTALSVLPEQTMPSAVLICGYLLVYVAALGPGNLLLLRVLKRRELAWVSIPVLVIACSLTAFLVGSYARGGEAVVNRLAVVQVWPDSEVARVDGLVGVFSPNRSAYDLELAAPALVHNIPDAPMLARRGGWTFIQTAAGGTRIPELRLDVSGMNAVSVETQTQAEHVDHSLVFSFSSNNRLALEGQVTNSTDMVLQNAVLLAPGQARQLGRLEPGQTQNVRLTFATRGQASHGGGQVVPQIGGQQFFPVSPETTVSDILGGTGYYYTDPKLHQQSNFLNALLSSSFGAASGRGSGVYLAAFVDGSPIEASLPGVSPRYSDTTLYIFTLQPGIEVDPGQLTLPPPLFTWELVSTDSAGMVNSPYNSYIDRGSHTFRFTLAYPLEYEAVSGLTLHLRSYGSSGMIDLDVMLWDYASGQWVSFPDLSWGSIAISEPERFVSAEGEVLLRLSKGDGFVSVPLESADFTLEVQR